MTSLVSIDITNTARESRTAVTQCVSDLPWTTTARKLDPNANLIWIDRALPVKKFYLQRLGANRRTYQRANRFFGMDSIVTKCALAKALEALEALESNIVRQSSLNVNSKDDSILSTTTTTTTTTTTQCMPKSWCLPRDYTLFETLVNPNSTSWYIAKPDRGRCGRGIALFPNPTKLMTAFRTGELSPEDDKEPTKSKSSTNNTVDLQTLNPVIVQEYIANPLLYRDTGQKFDLRVYVLIKSLSPLSVYVFEEGLVRVASTKYETPTELNCNTATMHLTNSHINSKIQGSGDAITQSESESDQQSKKQMPLKHCITDTLQWISQTYNVPVADIWTSICQSVATAIVAIYPSASLIHSTCFAPNREEHSNQCFQLLGVDVILDNELKPWVLEINNSPSLNLSTEADVAIKVPLIKDMMMKVFGREGGTEGEMEGETEGTDGTDGKDENVNGEKKKGPTFSKLIVNDTIVDMQNRMLDLYRKMCGWKPSSCRPVKGIKVSKSIYEKMIKQGIELPLLKGFTLNTFMIFMVECDDYNGMMERIEEVLR